MSDKKGRLNLYLSSDRNAITLDKLADLVVVAGYNLKDILYICDGGRHSPMEFRYNIKDKFRFKGKTVLTSELEELELQRFGYSFSTLEELEYKIGNFASYRSIMLEGIHCLATRSKVTQNAQDCLILSSCLMLLRSVADNFETNVHIGVVTFETPSFFEQQKTYIDNLITL